MKNSFEDVLLYQKLKQHTSGYLITLINQKVQKCNLQTDTLTHTTPDGGVENITIYFIQLETYRFAKLMAVVFG